MPMCDEWGCSATSSIYRGDKTSDGERDGGENARASELRFLMSLRRARLTRVSGSIGTDDAPLQPEAACPRLSEGDARVHAHNTLPDGWLTPARHQSPILSAMLHSALTAVIIARAARTNDTSMHLSYWVAEQPIQLSVGNTRNP